MVLTRDGQQQRFDLSVSEGLDDAWEEVLEGLRQDRQMLQQDEEIQSVVFQTEFHALPDAARMCVVRFVDVFHESPSGEVAFLFIEPLCGGWVVGEDEAGSDSHADSDNTLDDEEPSPSCEAHVAVQVAQNTGCKQASKHVRQRIS